MTMMDEHAEPRQPTEFGKNGTRVDITFSWLWVFLFGVLYFAYHGNWKHFAISFLLAIFTNGLSWLIYPFFARPIMRQHFLEQGYMPIQ
jgi:hypothetical protein